MSSLFPMPGRPQLPEERKSVRDRIIEMDEGNKQDEEDRKKLEKIRDRLKKEPRPKNPNKSKFN